MLTADFTSKRTPTPRRLPQPLDGLERRATVHAARPFRVHYCNTPTGYIDVPAGAELELVGASPRSGLPIVACPALGLAHATVDPASLTPDVGNVRADP